MLRKFLLASALTASAAAAPALSAHAQDASGPYNWTGVYAGVNIGGAWTTSCSSLVATAPDGSTTFANGNCPSDGRFIGGGQVGYNYQMGQVVFGLEGDVGGGTSGSQNIVRTTPGTDEIPGGTYVATGSQTPGVIFTIRARVGYAFDRALVYVTGGGAGFAAVSSGSGCTISLHAHRRLRAHRHLLRRRQRHPLRLDARWWSGIRRDAALDRQGGGPVRQFRQHLQSGA